jgi:uncharacterized protein (TIGR03000 family)
VQRVGVTGLSLRTVSPYYKLTPCVPRSGRSRIESPVNVLQGESEMPFHLHTHLHGSLVLVVVAVVTPALIADPAAPPDKALVLVRLPASAALVIGSSPTQQLGPERLFISPKLEAGKRYIYTLTATWLQSGTVTKLVREVEVRAGDLSKVDFTEPDVGDGVSRTDAPRSRTFQFTYGAIINGLKPDEAARVWLPVPQSSHEQDVTVVSSPNGAKINKEKKHGNAMYFCEAKADADGKIAVEMVFFVKRKEVKGEGKLSADEAAKLNDFLKPDATVPIEGKPLELIKDKKLPTDQIALARVLYDAVNGHMRYSKEGQGWGRGDSVWACESGYGNCTDFHSLFMSLARANKIPTKFEIGFPIPEKRGSGEVSGYHCWAKFRPEGKGWIAVDISEANKNPKLKDYYFGSLTEDRVTFTTGRDLELSPKQDGEPLNFFIYPYVEVGGKPYPQEKIVRKFSYRDE